MTVTEPLPQPPPPLEDLLNLATGPHAWLYRGPTQRVTGGAHGWLISPGDCYVASRPINPDDIDLVAVLQSAHRRISWLSRRKRELADLYRAAKGER